MSVAQQIESIKNSLPQGVELVAVSKYHPVEALREAYDAGQRLFGENRPQEMTAKAAVMPDDVRWMMIGHLQTNKVRMIMPYVAMIQSVDSARLTSCIDTEAARVGRTVDILMEVHVAAEQTKSGWDEQALVDYLQSDEFAALRNIRVRGIMGMATNTDNEAVIRADFEHLAAIRRRLAPLLGEQFDTLSMGMSDDWQLAVECGSTIIRVGSTIFGEREY